MGGALNIPFNTLHIQTETVRSYWWKPIIKTGREGRWCHYSLCGTWQDMSKFETVYLVLRSCHRNETLLVYCPPCCWTISVPNLWWWRQSQKWGWRPWVWLFCVKVFLSGELRILVILWHHEPVSSSTHCVSHTLGLVFFSLGEKKVIWSWRKSW